MDKIYERIEIVISKSGLTKKEFARQIGISTGNLGDWKSGKSAPSAGALIRIAERFQVSLDWLMLGRTAEQSAMMESIADYFFEEKWQLDYHKVQNLSEDEHRFIREYIDFVDYRKNTKKNSRRV